MKTSQHIREDTTHLCSKYFDYDEKIINKINYLRSASRESSEEVVEEKDQQKAWKIFTKLPEPRFYFEHDAVCRTTEHRWQWLTCTDVLDFILNK